MWQPIRDALIRAVVLWSAMQGTRRQGAAVLSLLVVDVSLAIPVHKPPDTNVEENFPQLAESGPPAPPRPVHLGVSLRQRLYAEEERRQVEPANWELDTNWWVWVTVAHTDVDAYLYLPWHQFLLWAVRNLQRRAY